MNSRAPSPTPRLVQALLASLLLCAACDEDPQAPADRLLVVDGIEVTLADVEPYVEFLGSSMPESGRKTRIQQVLEDHVLPVRLARRAFAADRQRELEKAKGLCSVATNVHELDEQSRPFSDRRRGNLTRRARIPVAMFLFAPENTGAVSPPLEVPFGWIVAGAYELKQGPLLIDDYADALLVGFATHTQGDWQQWLDAEKQRIAGKVTWVHPDYREAMPSWLQLPKLP